MNRRLLFLAAVFPFLTVTPWGHADEKRAVAPSAPPAIGVKGLRVLTAGHSFHFWMPPLLKDVAASAGIPDHQIVDIQYIGGSQVIAHWNVPDDKNKIKPALIAGKADVLTLSPVYLPDPGIEKFTKLGLEHNPDLKVTVQEFWLPYDDQSLWATRAKGVTIDRDKKTIEELRQAHAPYFAAMDELVTNLNKDLGKQTVFIVPLGQAVLALREKVIKGEVPGVAKQSMLFTDVLGHPQNHIKMLSTYCHFAVLYHRSPVGLPLPPIFRKAPEGEKLNRLLQELAWDAVIKHPLSGVKASDTASN